MEATLVFTVGHRATELPELRDTRRQVADLHRKSPIRRDNAELRQQAGY